MNPKDAAIPNWPISAKAPQQRMEIIANAITITWLNIKIFQRIIGEDTINRHWSISNTLDWLGDGTRTHDLPSIGGTLSPLSYTEYWDKGLGLRVSLHMHIHCYSQLQPAVIPDNLFQNLGYQPCCITHCQLLKPHSLNFQLTWLGLGLLIVGDRSRPRVYTYTNHFVSWIFNQSSVRYLVGKRGLEPLTFAPAFRRSEQCSTSWATSTLLVEREGTRTLDAATFVYHKMYRTLPLSYSLFFDPLYYPGRGDYRSRRSTSRLVALAAGIDLVGSDPQYPQLG